MSRTSFSISSERRWLLIFALLTMLALSLPYALGFASQGAEWRFTGFVFGVEDGNSYIAKMLRGANGDWLFRTPYTAYPQNGVFAYLPYLLLGKLVTAPASHTALAILYHLARIAAGVAAIFAMYDFIALFLREIKWRRWGIVLASWGGGLGWLLLLFGRNELFRALPLEFYSPESFGFLTLYGLPHLVMARALLFWGLTAYLRLETPPWKPGLLWLLMGLFQPLNVPLTWALIAVHLGLLTIQEFWQFQREIPDWARWRRWLKRAIWAGALSSPLVLYTLAAFSADPVMMQWAAQNQITSPPALHYLLAYGLLLPPALWVLPRIWRSHSPQKFWLLSWILAFPVLVYSPVDIQRRLAEGFWVALVTLALLTLEALPKSRAGKVQRALFLAFPSTIVLLLGTTLGALRPQTPLFRPVGEVAAFEYLNQTADKDAVVLSAYETGNPLPAWAPVFVVIGHGPESIYLDELKPRVAAFYDAAAPDSSRLELLTEFGVDYVFWGPAERDLGNWNPADAPYLEPVFQRGGYEIYQVIP